MSSRVNFVAFANIGAAIISAANTNRDGTGTLVQVLVAPSAGSGRAGGSRIERIRVCALGTTTDGMVRLFLDNGTARWLYDEIGVEALVPSAVIKAFRKEIECKDLVLPAGWTLKASTHNAESFAVLALGGDF